MDFESWRGKSVGEWLESLVQPFTKLFMEAVMRLGAIRRRQPLWMQAFS